MKVEALMNKNVAAGGIDSNLAQIAQLMWDHDCGMVPIVDGDQRVMGVITDRDICIASASRNQAPAQMQTADVMNHGFFYCQPGDRIEQALEVMAAEQVRRLPVVDTQDRLLGVLSINDVMLNAESRRRRDAVSYQEAIETLKAISQHRHVNDPMRPQDRAQAIAAT